jgi:hypothetical protein
MNKSNKQKNTEHDQREVIRPKQPDYNFKELEAVIRQWVKGRE